MAEYTLAAILFANKRVFQLNQAYLDKRENRAPWTREAPNVGNYQKTVGIVGASSVGRLVIEYLQKHDVKTLVYDPYITPLEARRFGAAKAGLAELLANSDVVSLHAPLLPETRNLIGARELALMKDHSTFINTARGRLVACLSRSTLLLPPPASLGPWPQPFRQFRPQAGAGIVAARATPSLP